MYADTFYGGQRFISLANAPHGSHSCIIIIAPINFLAGFIRCGQTAASFVLFGLVLLISVLMFDVSFSALALLFG